MKAHHMGNPGSYLEVKRSKFKVTVSLTKFKSIAAICFYSLLLARYVYAYIRDNTGTATLNSYAVPVWLFLYILIPSYR